MKKKSHEVEEEEEWSRKVCGPMYCRRASLSEFYMCYWFLSVHYDQGNDWVYGVKDRPIFGYLHFCLLLHNKLRRIIKDLQVEIGDAIFSVDFHVMNIHKDWKISLLLGRAFMVTMGAVCNMQTNKLCLTFVDKEVFYDPVWAMVRGERTCPTLGLEMKHDLWLTLTLNLSREWRRRASIELFLSSFARCHSDLIVDGGV